MPRRALLWDDSRMEQFQVARAVERRMKTLRLTAKSLSKRAGLNETFVRDLLEGRSRNPRADSLEKLAKALDCAVGDLTGDRPNSATQLHSNRERSEEDHLSVARIDELDVRAAAGPGQNIDSEAKIGEWQLPRELVKIATHSPVESIKILTIVGDSMVPTYNPIEKVMVDTGDVRPSPPGVFVVWDGLGFVVKRIEFMPHSDPPRVKITSDNPKYTAYERVLGEAYIQGRVLGKWLWV
jgi:phage repressor protein C with HTH and peptisase S24 domain